MIKGDTLISEYPLIYLALFSLTFLYLFNRSYLIILLLDSFLKFIIADVSA